MGFAVQQDIVVDGQQVDVLAEKIVPGIGFERIVVECKDEARPIGNKTVQTFAHTVTALRESGGATRGALVSASGFTAPAKGVALRNDHLKIFSWDELSRDVFNVTPGLRTLRADYERQEISHNFVNVGATRISWAGSAGGSSEPIEAVDEWLLALGQRSLGDEELATALLLTGDYGAGKTTIIRRLQYNLAKAHLAASSSVIPLYVALRQFNESRDLNALLRSSFRDQFYIDMPTELLWEKINLGAFVVLLDGFDEMAERSDEIRRLNLFRALLPVLTSPSMAVLTTRPSFLVGHDELNTLLRFLRGRETSLSDASLLNDSIGRLTHILVDRNRESRPGVGAYDLPSGQSVSLLHLLPLGRPQIIQYIQHWAPQIQSTRGLTADEVLAFIDKTYDLHDLATRPLLLKLIIDTVLDDDELDLRDTDLQLGPSGLYEAYTTAKLKFDVAKGEVREGGLPMDVRRELAEVTALKMHELETLEVDLADVIRYAKSDSEVMASGLASTRLSDDEIATDFATCSFVTVEDGQCRFIHKSFREFFVARVLKDRIGSSHPSFRTKLEQEVLYFIGGFAPTQPPIAVQLWDSYKNARAAGDEPLARNLLCAYLYTRPDHAGRKVENAVVSDVRYRTLGFSRCSFIGGVVTVAEFEDLSFDECTLDGLLVDKTRIGALSMTGGTARTTLADSLVNRLTIDRASSDISLVSGSVVEEISLNSARLALTTNRDDGGIDVRTMSATSCVIRLGAADPEQLSSSPSVSALDVRDSAVLLGNNSCIRSATVDSCLFLLVEPGLPVFLAERTPGTEQLAIVTPSPAHREQRLGLPRLQGSTCGFFDFEADVDAVSRPAPGWGVAAVPQAVLSAAGATDRHDGIRSGQMYFVSDEWYGEHVQEDGLLSAIVDLHGFTSDVTAKTPGVDPHPGEVTALLRRLREQHAGLAVVGLWLSTVGG